MTSLYHHFLFTLLLGGIILVNVLLYWIVILVILGVLVLPAQFCRR